MSITELRLVPLEVDKSALAEHPPLIHHAIPLVMTIGRIPIIFGIIAFFFAGSPWISITLLAAFIIIDIFDGEVARKLGTETSLRRFLDGFIDRISVHFVILSVATEIQFLWIPWLILAVRDILQSIVGAKILWRNKIVAAGAKWHRSYTISLAVWGSAIFISGSTQWLFAGITIAISLLTLFDYACRVNRLLILEE